MICLPSTQSIGVNDESVRYIIDVLKDRHVPTPAYSCRCVIRSMMQYTIISPDTVHYHGNCYYARGRFHLRGHGPALSL